MRGDTQRQSHRADGGRRLKHRRFEGTSSNPANQHRGHKKEKQVQRHNGDRVADDVIIEPASKALDGMLFFQRRAGAQAKTAAVVVLTPPAVEPGEPPISISPW